MDHSSGGGSDPLDMLSELRDDKAFARHIREAHSLWNQHRNVATASVLENLIDEAERRTWFLYEASRRGDPTGHSAPALRAGQRGSRSVAAHSIMDTRRDQMFPVLEPAEIKRL